MNDKSHLENFIGRDKNKAEHLKSTFFLPIFLTELKYRLKVFGFAVNYETSMFFLLLHLKQIDIRFEVKWCRF